MTDREPLPGWGGIVSPGGAGRALRIGHKFCLTTLRSRWVLWADLPGDTGRVAVMAGDAVYLHSRYNPELMTAPRWEWGITDTPVSPEYDYNPPVESALLAQFAAEDAARVMVREMADALGLGVQAEPCRWTWNDCYYWDTACGTTADYSDPRRPGVSFCHGCGGRILAGEGVSDG